MIPQRNQSPIILDESYDLTETVTLAFGSENHEGLLAQADLGAAFVSMSGYEKSPIPITDEDYSASRLHPTLSPADYDGNSIRRSSMYVPYNHANFADNQVQPFYSRPVDQMSSSFYQPTAYEAMQPHYSDFYARKVPEITSYSPQLGHQGTRVYVHLQSEHPLDSPLPQYLMFASYRAPTLVTRLEQRGSSYHYVASADAPTFSSTSWVGAQVPLRMHLQDGSGDLGMIDVGIFSYTDGAHHQNRTLSPELHSRKRKTAGDLEEMKMPVKRSSSQQLHSGGIDSHIPNPYSQSESISYSQATQTVPANPSYDGTMPYGRPQVQQGLQDGSTSRRSPLGYYGGPPPDPLPNYASINPSGRSPRLAATSASRISSLSSPSLSANPPLIRTSTLPQTPGLTATPASAASGGPFNPYAMYPRKAVLKLSGDLDSMADRWTPEELLTKRRVVQFWRSQNGSTIDATFEPVAPEDRPPSSICISCILWAERQECFVTSVDTIYLLESLVAVRFTVEEKNRIRRNLEGFHPLTVSKAKSDSESFFKVIMGFGNPKPRNIEKDVKVFPWKILAHALKKIIGKYSASYASTAGALHGGRSSSYGVGGTPDTVDHSISSPRSSSTSTISSTYTTSMLSAAMSPIVSHGRLLGPSSFPDPPNLHTSGPNLVPAYTVPSSLHYHTPSQEPMNLALGPSPGTSQPTRTSLDYSSFMEASPRMGQSSHLQAAQYLRRNMNPSSSGSSEQHDIR